MKILFITLSNIGDCVLTLPTLDLLRASFPEAALTVMCAQRPAELFTSSPAVRRVIVYDKRSPLKDKVRLFFALKDEKFDIVIDLRNTFYGTFLPARFKSSPWRSKRILGHRRETHRAILAIPGLKIISGMPMPESIYVPPQSITRIHGMLLAQNVGAQEPIIVVAPGARSATKRWPKERFVDLFSQLSHITRAKIVLVGDEADSGICRYIREHSLTPVCDLSGKTSLAELTALLQRSLCVITNDSAVLHIASYCNVATVAIFGPTNEVKYGPWAAVSGLVKKDIFCRPCEKAQCRFGTSACLALVQPEDVVRAVRQVLAGKEYGMHTLRGEYKRILVARTDRIGDVLLSTPLFTALRHAYPHSYIAAMVGPHAKDIVTDNPDIDGVLIYDKDGQHKGWFSTWKFSQRLKAEKFDLAILAHPTNRVHLIAFLAGIARRIGLDRKMGFLLTDKLPHLKHLGQKHEREYVLDLVRCLGVAPLDISLKFSLKKDAEKWADEYLKENRIGPGEPLLAIHPAASCSSKIWPPERFARVADILAEKFGLKVLIVAGPKDTGIAGLVAKSMQQKSFNLAGQTSVSQLASLLKRCRLFISNDSGPVHLASAVGTPVLAIFGRSQKGLSPHRWGPVGHRDAYVHKDVGCIECLAHNCNKSFLCLSVISAEDVVAAAESLLLAVS